MRAYYNHRHGHVRQPLEFLLREVADFIALKFGNMERLGYMQKAFGYHCVDDGIVLGEVGEPLSAHFLRCTHVRTGGGLVEFLTKASKVELFTALEFIHDHIAKPDQKSGWEHTFSNCGWHFQLGKARFDVEAGRAEWRSVVNDYLKGYGEGYELTPQGEVCIVAPPGFDPILQKSAPQAAPENEHDIVARAVTKFRRGVATRQDRKDAIGELYKILERHREDVVKSTFTKKDNAALFGIANEFTIRHYREGQLDDYDDGFLAWLFYVYLSTVHLVLELAHGKDPEPVPEPEPELGPFDDDEYGDGVPF